MERPGGSKFNLETVLRVAAALDVAFIGRFASFSELAGWAESFSPDTFVIPSFQVDPGFREQVTVPTNIRTTVEMLNNPLLPRVFQPDRLRFVSGINLHSTVPVTHSNTVNPHNRDLKLRLYQDQSKSGTLMQSHLEGNVVTTVMEP